MIGDLKKPASERMRVFLCLQESLGCKAAPEAYFCSNIT
ncbi:hypothetical protein RK21_04915 [Pseudomonas plecoglossicida]|nr:hypothetical protein RK21_04915 [Pseudomonas plecoglossicida]